MAEIESTLATLGVGRMRIMAQASCELSLLPSSATLRSPIINLDSYCVGSENIVYGDFPS
jgi:hypothetical protein